MKKLKKLWRENSVLFVLLIILIACVIAISIVVANYFVGSSTSKYGDRLEEVGKHPFKDNEQSEVISKIEEDDKVENAKLRISGKTIYVTIVFVPKTTLVEAQSKALATLEYFSEDLLGFYDIEYMIKAESTEDADGFSIMGTHNVSGTGGIVWNNNTPVKEKEKE